MGNIDGFKQALEALQAVDEKSRERILQDIGKKNPQLALKLREGLFSFADLQFLLAPDFKILWWELPRKTWQLALRKAPPGVIKMLQSHLSQRAFAEFSELIKSQAPQPVSLVLEAQKEIIDTARSLVDQGKMAAPNAKKNDQFV